MIIGILRFVDGNGNENCLTEGAHHFPSMMSEKLLFAMAVQLTSFRPMFTKDSWLSVIYDFWRCVFSLNVTRLH